MAKTIDKHAPTVWMLVKVPRITDVGSGQDCTAAELRKCVQENHFGGEKAAVRRLTKAEVLAIRSANRPAYGISLADLGDEA